MRGRNERDIQEEMHFTYYMWILTLFARAAQEPCRCYYREGTNFHHCQHEPVPCNYNLTNAKVAHSAETELAASDAALDLPLTPELVPDLLGEE
jgi:hypothetical protein